MVRHGREGSTRGKSRSKSIPKKAVQCYKCKDYGHMRKDCPRLKEQNEDSSKSANVIQNDDSDFGDRDMLVVSTN